MRIYHYGIRYGYDGGIVSIIGEGIGKLRGIIQVRDINTNRDWFCFRSDLTEIFTKQG